ncbi:MAG: hypothetical protein A3G33_08520 [Omnitrophica bacterium RIFCSPLOWO2_12_FULL_44_17]|uniref:Response regulatory domain-containing protein n=1 Tax=Candidatus Danuiimicrobium aquiferis TaxID=1801832 RepID=A0A1G1KX86_9BACT|nr:MAG: hypothetical protein A3B72_03740 [Omnitrophica bacterium RIFCSPHIGHO2_02_FULL_45_28]OGW90301.1 MAG: hypothetical protein A3E74_01275 [Omnitrophica bacterium RIFCSPHIGHO2_12_FULL_44_12]OGW97209.1 MAG: hypothetical protein A3G33_08520 [Omnitrophica bacterium RIFCSPLOWO2_12_FULL_44_17]OGX02265.1 MAG: hypothetical protein A3J12_08310 [Omnitrophica bacterium RIFCSPLOWO2_02_FULL_44_11]
MSSKPTTVLIVDDNISVIEQLTLHFKKRNYEPIATADPTVVERTLDTFNVDLMLLDLKMERLTGYDILKMMREKKLNIPVLIITAYYKDEKDKLAELGVTEKDIIVKPFNSFEDVEKKINQKLNRIVIPGEFHSEYEDKIYRSNTTRVVIIDDEEDICDFIKEALIDRNYQVEIFDRGDRGLEYVLNNECHIVVVDIHIPGSSGHDIIKQILAKKPALKIIPITAGYEQGAKDGLAAVGFPAEKLILKPFKLPNLVELIKVYATELGTLKV